ncbi:hypothetical protein DSO57_1034967 [Entomophthora muscae]|uniref:Uncharacterized protein n=1 Tax=Entomophthora muscae TaxID=34485 RepID=A0ACC2TXJ2_9FUNG|nr:hypothetical protein DSO57_1034967 [Entomophthora muscae]
MPSFTHGRQLSLDMDLDEKSNKRQKPDESERGKLVSNAGYTMGRSFRAGWGPLGNLYFVGRDGTQVCDVHVGGGICSLTLAPKETIRDRHVTTLSAYLPAVALVDTPAVTKDTPAQAKPIEPSWTELSKEINEHPQLFDSFELHLWRLLPILFRPTAGVVFSATTPEASQKARMLLQKQKLTKWLSTAVQSDIYPKHSKPTATHALDKILELLSANLVKEAVVYATQKKYHRLGILISQAGGDSYFKHFMLNQICEWVSGRTIVSIDTRLVKIYFLLAGIVYPSIHARTCPEALSNLVSSVDSLTTGASWLKSFALAFWYSAFYDQPITTALNEYDAASNVARPCAWYVQENGPDRYCIPPAQVPARLFLSSCQSP